MAKTLEELKEAINNVISENDKGEITATALNTILQDMSDTLSELGSSGGGQFDLYCNIVENTDPDTMETNHYIIECDEEQKELNKQIYDKIAAGERCPLVIHINDIQNYLIEGAKINLSSTCIYVMFVSDVPDDMFEGMPYNTKGFLQFINYGVAMAGTESLMLIDSGEIIMSI